MKRRDFFKVTGATIAALALRAVAQGDTVDAPGAVKIELSEYVEEGNGSRAGWILLNTNTDGQLLVEVHLEQGDPLRYFDVRVTVNDELHEEDVVWLITNEQGKGNAHLSLSIDEYPENPDEPDVLYVLVDLWWTVEEEE